MITVDERAIHFDTRTMTGTLCNGWLTSLTDKASSQHLVDHAEDESGSLQLGYPVARAHNTLPYETELAMMDVITGYYGSIVPRQVGPTQAEFRLHGWNGDGVIFVSEDRETGALIVEPSAYSSRAGVAACRWRIAGIRDDLQLVAPFFQGIRLSMDDTLIRNTRWPWPVSWEAGMVILEGKNGGLWIHAQDTRLRSKAIQVGGPDSPFELGLDTEVYGPTTDNLAAGGLAWRVNTYSGNWQEPASEYKSWMVNAFSLGEEIEQRADWVRDLRLAVIWTPVETDVLRDLQHIVDPARVLLHVPRWRTAPYDQRYPDYIETDDFRAFCDLASQMGYHVAPHGNALEIDPSHELYPLVRDFRYRSIDQRMNAGWSSYCDWNNGRLDVPNSSYALSHNQDRNVMTKVHPGLGMWRSLLAESIGSAVRRLELHAFFLDVTFNTYNLHNGRAEDKSTAEGMLELLDYIRTASDGAALGGEGLNEITARKLSFAQEHLFKSYSASVEGIERTASCPLNHHLFGDLCRTIEYHNVRGDHHAQRLRQEIHKSHGTIPTLHITAARELRERTGIVAEILEQATSNP